MSDNWYYVLSGERKGPVALSHIKELYKSSKINSDDHVWRKGFENWVRIRDVKELSIDTQSKLSLPDPIILKQRLEEKNKNLNFSENSKDEKIYFIKVGADRGQAEIEYGPFDLETLIKLYKENRINAKTFVFAKGLDNWQLLSLFSDFAETFDDLPPTISEEDKRSFKRKPFIARMFIKNEEKIFEGICRDVSIGGMQVLIDQFPGTVGDINVHPESLEHSFVASGKIVRVLEGKQGFSFRFYNLQDDALLAITSYISEQE